VEQGSQGKQGRTLLRRGATATPQGRAEGVANAVQKKEVEGRGVD